ncbi:uncharacterized protein M421DRAFT_103942 [Didymella exigua CBS 183.55]|uniref:Uncharacterized protein n=1 Tax=Didymella exigua CBS 183.55 TaxID=1150837 RepID=A0A6A5RC08_9PLEO|nr:uncharacterized protein M421DRAFT_103942 [Didymella exigua CBS 183.55]KAF1924156.1 hypothetical protein M421DRAFT_103942 [Didymella exigua CBS 183.55]
MRKHSYSSFHDPRQLDVADFPAVRRSLKTQSQPDAESIIDHVPGEPNVDLSQPSVYGFLSSEFHTPVLDELHPHLREILAIEDISLHLVWHRSRINIKPMPLFLLNYDFWAKPVFDRSIALGFMLTYALLVRHRLDFFLAREAHLFPEDLDWTQRSKLIAHFHHVQDDEVAERYRYGQPRLSRLNWAVRIFRPASAFKTKWFYIVPHWSVLLYLARALTPLIFSFASLSLVLSSMQVILAISGDELGIVDGLKATKAIFWLFSVIVLVFSTSMWMLLFGSPMCGFVWQLSWGQKHRERTLTKVNTPHRTGNTAKV